MICASTLHYEVTGEKAFKTWKSEEANLSELYSRAGSSWLYVLWPKSCYIGPALSYLFYYNAQPEHLGWHRVVISKNGKFMKQNFFKYILLPILLI